MHFTCIQSNIQGQQSIICIQTSFASSSAISSTFNPLSKVLFMFPSWYLFAIGFTFISSLGWKLPPNLHSNSKERDSYNTPRIQWTTHLTQVCHLPRNPVPKHLYVHLCWNCIWRKQVKVIDLNFHTRLIPVHSPLLKNSHLVSDPPLTYMLKFSRLVCLISCLCALLPGFAHQRRLQAPSNAWQSFMQQEQHLMHTVPTCNFINMYETLTQACPQECPKGTSAFNGQLIHGILQFTMIIALRCTLHQHVNQDICCWNCSCHKRFWTIHTTPGNYI